ncbi:adenylate kinase [Microcoleus sp. ARI1-B5]|uniref:adenylate kinase n=1 Tax=unclassified Microcoleus TaxID=2642155 RepID=UPI002FCEE317
MKKVAVFGNAGGGKSTLSKRLSDITGLPLHVLDKIQYRSGDVEVSQFDYKRAHQEILQTERWIIDGFGCMETVWLRLDEADTLVFVDLPLYVHFWWVTKRMISGYFKPPEGWPENSPILKSSISSYRVLGLCDKYLSPKYREYIDRARSTKTVYHIRSTEQISQFLESIENETKIKDGELI